MATNLYVYGLFVVAAVSVYSLIYSRQNKLVTFILIPLILGVSIWTWHAIKILQGTPLDELIWDKQAQVIWAYQDKPNIYLVARMGKSREPTYFVIPWTEENMYKIKKIQEGIQQKGSVQGTFKKPRGYTGAQRDFFFSEVERFEDRVRKEGFHQGYGP
jgi:hypothetical protein